MHIIPRHTRRAASLCAVTAHSSRLYAGHIILELQSSGITIDRWQLVTQTHAVRVCKAFLLCSVVPKMCILSFLLCFAFFRCQPHVPPCVIETLPYFTPFAASTANPSMAPLRIERFRRPDGRDSPLLLVNWYYVFG